MVKYFQIPTNFSNESSSQNNVTCRHIGLSYPASSSIMLLSATSLIGNVLITFVVYKREELRRTINYFIVNMALSDCVFSLVGISNVLLATVNSSWQWPIGGTAGEIICKLKQFLEGVTLAVTLQSLLWIALDRFVAVVLPMKAHFLSSTFRSCAIASTWIVAMLGNSFYFYEYKVLEEYGKVTCTHFLRSSNSYLMFVRVYTAVFQIAPFIVMTILYSVIAVTLKRRDRALGTKEVHQRNQMKKRAIKMTFCIIVAFHICYLPSLMTMLVWGYRIAVTCSLMKVLWYVAVVMFYLSSTVNPIICFTFIQSYRKGLKEVLKLSWIKRLTPSNMENGEQTEGIVLQRLRTSPGIKENLAFSDA